MDATNAKKRITQLRNELNFHNHAYYVLDKPQITDYEFDQLLSELSELEIQFPEFESPLSPTKRVGGQTLSKFNQFPHRLPMLSLANTYSEGELIEFDNRIRKVLESDPEYVAELKFDGVAISLQYRDGQLIRALTRGDGNNGDDVTENIKTIASIPLELKGNYPNDLEVRGEVYLPKKRFEALNKKRQEQGLELYANPRNFASGSLKLLNTKETALRKLDAYIYAVYTFENAYKTHAEQLKEAKNWGFKVSSWVNEPTKLEGVLEYIEKVEKNRSFFDFDIDGVVVKLNNLNYREILGFTAKLPRWAVAFKFKPESVSTQLESVSFQVGRTGAITPVANLKPVLLAGTTVKRASLYNEAEINRLDLHLGDYVFIEKGGDIIPKVTAVDKSKRLLDAKAVTFIDKCPECNSILVQEEGEAIKYCPNQTECPPQAIGRLEHFVARKAMNIDSIGKETIIQLFESNLVRNVADFYTLQFNQLITLERMGEKSVNNILHGIEASKMAPFQRVLFALGIRLVGETVAKSLANHFINIDNLSKAKLNELTAIHEIGEKIAEQTILWFQNDANQKIIERLKSYGLKLQLEENETSNLTNKLAGKSFVVTGTFNNYSRDELKKIIEQNGGKVLSAISGKLNFLLAGDNMGPSKLQKATDLGVEIISETDFNKLLLNHVTPN